MLWLEPFALITPPFWEYKAVPNFLSFPSIVILELLVAFSPVVNVAAVVWSEPIFITVPAPVANIPVLFPVSPASNLISVFFFRLTVDAESA